MKKILCLLTCLCSFACFRAAAFSETWTYGHIHVTVTDSSFHDTASCSGESTVWYTVTIDSSYLNDSVRFVDTTTGTITIGPFVNTTGVSPWTFTTPHTSNGSWDTFIPVSGGFFHFWQTPLKVTTPLETLRYVVFEDSFWVVPCPWGTVSGDVYVDNNSNCIFDAGDVGLNNVPVQVIDTFFGGAYPSRGLLTSYAYYSATSHVPYSSNVQQSWMTNYSVSLPSWFSFIFPTSSCYTGPYTFTTLPQTHVDFPLQCTSSVDVQCYALSPDHVRLHTPFFLHPYVTNFGCDTMSGTMTLVLDSRVSYDSALSTFPADTVRGDTLIWNYSGLSNLALGTAYWNSFFSNVYLVPSSALVAGDSLCFLIYTNVPSADVNPANNRYSICLPVTYSYDPNSKSVTPAAIDAAGTFPAGTHTLNYTINFQNTGTDYAYNVKIIDTLNSHLNPHSLRILGTSAAMLPQWLAPNIVEFDFNNIMLPDSSANEPGSHGQVRFSIDLNAGVPAGTPITNTGYIYFDANPAVVTNTTHNVTSWPAEVAVVKAPANIKVYPNPATDELTVENAGECELTVLNISGVTLFTQYSGSNKTTLDISHLSPGVYILKATGDQSPSVTRFTKY